MLLPFNFLSCTVSNSNLLLLIMIKAHSSLYHQTEFAAGCAVIIFDGGGYAAQVIVGLHATTSVDYHVWTSVAKELYCKVAKAYLLGPVHMYYNRPTHSSQINCLR